MFRRALAYRIAGKPKLECDWAGLVFKPELLWRARGGSNPSAAVCKQAAVLPALAPAENVFNAIDRFLKSITSSSPLSIPLGLLE